MGCMGARHAADARDASDVDVTIVKGPHPEEATFTIEAMRADDYDRCIEIAADAFLTNNPAVKHLGISADAWKKFTRSDISRAAAVDSGLSLVARDKESGEILAFLFLVVCDFSKHPPPEILDLHPGLQTFYDLMVKLYEDEIRTNSGGLHIAPMVSGRALRCAMGGTSPAANGRGLGKALRLRAVEVARERKFRTLLVEPGHGATRHIWTVHCKGVIRAEVPFHSYKLKDGTLPLGTVEGSVSICEIMLRPSWFWDSSFMRPFSLVKMIVL